MGNGQFVFGHPMPHQRKRALRRKISGRQSVIHLNMIGYFKPSPNRICYPAYLALSNPQTNSNSISHIHRCDSQFVKIQVFVDLVHSELDQITPNKSDILHYVIDQYHHLSRLT